ncbi:hypothetical protein [Qipengyuania sediminis]|uniref:hypothetical protein n=1 Tax=Qipengyuania sediminis TaxID=1532023 RepID=UPI001059C8D3|nr:hypothetical protein [Qipengyuania sediminis]
MLQEVEAAHVGINALDADRASETLDCLIDYVSDLLPVTNAEYPDVEAFSRGEALEFCLRHSALHFSKTAGRLAAFVENVDHGKYDHIEKLQAIVAAGLINSLKLADEIGISGPEIIAQMRAKFEQLDRAG